MNSPGFYQAAFWLAVAVVMGVIEASTLGLTTIWFLLGALAAMGASMLGLGCRLRPAPRGVRINPRRQRTNCELKKPPASRGLSMPGPRATLLREAAEGRRSDRAASRVLATSGCRSAPRRV